MSVKRPNNFTRDVVYRIPQDQKPTKTARVIIGGLAGMLATVVVHPLDLIKVRIQVFKQSISTIALASKIIRCQGFGTLYVGLSAALMRQATNTTVRLGTYFWMFEDYHKKHEAYPKLHNKVMIGICAGMAGALAGNPSELALVRMMAATKTSTLDDKKCPVGVTKKYKGVFHAFYTYLQRCLEDIGIKVAHILFQDYSFLHTMFYHNRFSNFRVTNFPIVILTLSPIIQSHKQLNETNWFRKDLTVHLYSSLISSFLTGVFSLPIDLVKTIYQVNRDGLTQPQIIDDIIKTKGVKYFWKGFLPYFVRMTVHTALAYILVEELQQLYYANHDDDLPPQK